MKDINIMVTKSTSGAQTVIEEITDLVGNGFQFTKASMGGYISASLDFVCDVPTAWNMLGNYIGKRIVFASPYAEKVYSGSVSKLVWEGVIYTVRIDIDGTGVSRSLSNVYNAIDVQYAQLIGALGGTQKTTAQATSAASIAAYGTRQLRASAGAMTDVDATGLRDTMLTQYRNPLSYANGTNRRMGSQALPPSTTKGQTARVSIDCAGYWEYFDRLIYSNATTSNANLNVIVQSIFAAMVSTNPQVCAADYSDIQSNGLNRTQFFSAQATTARSALEACCALGDLSSGFSWCAGLGAFRKPYYRVMDFTQKYTTQLNDATGTIYDAATGEEVNPYLVEPGYLIRVEDLMPDSVNYTEGTQEARNQMIDTVTFSAPNGLIWTPRLAADQVNLKLNRLSGGYYEFGWNQWAESNDWRGLYWPTIGN